MKTILKTILILLSIELYAQPQRAYHWYFGGGAGIDFSSGQAVADTSGEVNIWEGCASISDENGNLLFYTDGSTVWNKNHQIMQNGTGLLGHWSSFQNSLIVPKPKSNNIYFLFTTDAQENNFQNGLRYSTVDLSIDSGRGAVTSKNVLLVAPTHEQLQATFHSNCEDIWVVTHKRDEEKFYAYLITETGINPPVVSEIGNATQLLWGASGLKFSPNGKKIASSNYWDWLNTGIMDTVELYDFDKSNGQISNRITLFSDTVNGALCFSIDNTKLYSMACGFEPKIRIFQYDLTVSNINNSKQLVYESTCSIFAYDAQISPLGDKIFLTNADYSWIPVINNPDMAGVSCDVQYPAFSLNGKLSSCSFPNFISTYFDYDSTSCFMTNQNQLKLPTDNIVIYPNPSSNARQITIRHENIIFYQIKLYTITGKEVFINTVKKQDETILEISGVVSGIYLLKLTTENNCETKRLIIQNN